MSSEIISIFVSVYKKGKKVSFEATELSAILHVCFAKVGVNERA